MEGKIHSPSGKFAERAKLFTAFFTIYTHSRSTLFKQVLCEYNNKTKTNLKNWN